MLSPTANMEPHPHTSTRNMAPRQAQPIRHMARQVTQFYPSRVWVVLLLIFVSAEPHCCFTGGYGQQSAYGQTASGYGQQTSGGGYQQSYNAGASSYGRTAGYGAQQSYGGSYGKTSSGGAYQTGQARYSPY